MNILLATGIYPPESGGPATYTRGLAFALAKRGHRVTVVAYGDRRSETVEQDVRIIRVPRRGGPVLRYLRYAWKVFSCARRADLVYAQGPVSEGLPATIGAKLAGRSLVMKMVGDYAWEMAQQKGEKDLLDLFLQKRHRGVIRFYEWAERWTSKRARRLIVPSRYLTTVVERWGVPSERIDVIKNAVEPLPSVRSRDEERQAFGVADRVVCLSIARAVPWKGIAELIQLWKQLPASHTFVYVDDGPELEKWKALAVTEGVADRVRFTGRVNRVEIARWIAVADVFLLNSGYEGYSHVVTEAASHGVPCLVSDQGGNPETVLDFGDLIRVLPYRDERAWVEALKSVTKRTTTVESPARWTHEQMVDGAERVLQETMGEQKEGKAHLVMVGYEKELLDVTSNAFHRISSFATNGMMVSAVVISRTTNDEQRTTNTFRSFGFSGSSFVRIWKAVRQGVRRASLIPGRTIVTAQDPFTAGLVGYLISRWTNTPLEVQEHADFFGGAWKKASWKHRIELLFAKWLIRRAERVRVVSERVKTHVEALGVPSHRIEVIPVAQDVETLLSRPFVNVSSTLRLIAPCRFVYQKGLDVLIEAMRIVKVKGLSLRLNIVGAGTSEDELRALVTKYGLTKEISFEPWKPSEHLWDEADALVMSSRWEGWGRTIVEAMAAGVSVVTTDVGCVGSFFRPNVDGLVVPSEDTQALAQAIERLATKPEERERMRTAARQRAAEFPSREILHTKQQLGWRSLLAPSKDVGPRWDLWVFGFILFVIASRALSVVLFHENLLNREWGFFTLVDHWLHGYGYSFAPELGCASAYRSPGFLFFLSALYTVFSPENTWAQAIIQNFFVVGILWLVYAVGKKLVGKRAALIGGFLMATYPYTFYHYSQYYHTFLSSFFLLLLVWFLFRLAETKRIAFAVGTGVATACLAYVQGTILPVMPFLSAWLLWMWWPDWKRTSKSVVVIAAVAVVMIAPWTYRNWTVFHRFIPLTTDLGHALFKANNEDIYALTVRGYPQEIVDEETVSSTNPNYKQYRMPADLEAEMRKDGDFRESIAWTEWHPKEPVKNLTTCADRGPMDEYQFNQYWTVKANAWIKANWWTEGWKLQLLKIKTFWQPALFPSVKTGVAWTFAGNPLKVWLARNAMTVASAIVIFGGWIGLLFALRRKNRLAIVPLVILCIYTFLHTLFAGYTKYRIPLDNLLAVYAGWTIIRLWDAWRGKKERKDL